MKIKTSLVKKLLPLILTFCISKVSLAQTDVTNDNIVIGQRHPDLGGVVFYLNGEGGGLIADDVDLLHPKMDNISMFSWTKLGQLMTPVNIDFT